MKCFDHFCDPFLLGLDLEEKKAIEERLNHWGLNNQSFAQRLDNWFCNFDSLEDKRLAYRVFHSMKYFSHEAFITRLEQLYGAIIRHLADTGNKPSDIILVTPRGAADSADRHAYDLVKNWQLLREQVYSVDELAELSFEDPVFVLFNDTHGTGNQFLNEIWPYLKEYGEHKIYVLAIAISSDALNRFRKEMPRVHVIPQIPIFNAKSVFTGEECERLHDIGKKVYATHPMGYGNTALLTAYYYQCPNNTLPIVWADGRNNNVNGNAYNWNPLFPYVPKKCQPAKPKKKTPKLKKKLADEKSKKETTTLSYRYRVGLIDLDMGISNFPQLALEFNKCQRYFHFTAPTNADNYTAREAVISIHNQKNLSVYEIDKSFFEQFDQLAVDVVGCFTKHALAFADPNGHIRYNFISGPSKVDSRFMFISAYQLHSFVQKAKCSLEEGLAHILVSQLVVCYTEIGFHGEISECPMDFCDDKENIVLSLKKREFCPKCVKRFKDENLLEALNKLLRWHPEL